MNKGHTGPAIPGRGALPADAREALQWFVNTHGLYIGSTRGLFVTEWAEEREASLEAAIINLKSRGFHPLAVTGDTLYKQADYLWKESRQHTQFGRPLASKLELELGGSDLVIVDNLEAPENSRHLWYLFSHLLYPRTIAGKATIITTPLSFPEFMRYGEACNDPDFCGKSINWEKLVWLIEASMVTLDVLKQAREEGLPPMLKAEYQLYKALKERGLDVIPQHVLGDFMLDFALFDKERRLNIECDTLSPLSGSEVQRQEAKRNLVLFSDGWQVLKFTTSEILGNQSACVDVVDDVWRSGRKRGSLGRVFTGNSVPPMPDLPVDDDVQMAAITYGGGPAAVCGGAGTGKTTCIIQRVSYLIGQGVSPESILVITHATDTQRALKRQIEGVLEKQTAQKLNVCSWHDLGLKILKENLPAIRRKPPLKVEPSPQKIVSRLLTKAKKDIDPAKLELSVDLDEFYIAAVISMYKAHLISPKQAREEAGSYSEEIIARIYQQLEDQLQKANRIDRDDVITMSVLVLLDTPDLRARYQRQFEFVLIDEYQDVTVAQDMLARLLASPQDNLFIVGDEDETICEAKNACPELFTEASLRMPHARCYTLERNWRSHPAIVDHARQLISLAQKRRVAKEFMSAWGQAPASAIIGPAVLADEYDEANWVADEIQLLIDSGRSYGDIAILFRHHVYATILEETLDKKGVRYQASNPITNFIPDEVEDMLAFLKLVMDPDGPRARESFERVCQLRAKEIDPKLSGTIASFAEANNLSYLKAVEIYSEATADQSCRELEQLVRIIRTMHQEKLPPAETIALIRRTQRLNDYYRTVKVPAGVNYEPLKKLTQLEEDSRSFKSISDFVKHVTSQKSTGTGLADPGVQVIPLLDSKGLEFPVVFMVGMAEGIFPSASAIDLEEERRICYVGFTRAKELLYLSCPQMFSGAPLMPSHFMVEARLMAALPPPPAVHVPADVGAAPVPPVQPVQQPVVQQPVQQPVQPAAPVVAPVQPIAPQPVQPAQMPVAPLQMPVQPQPAPHQIAAQVPVQQPAVQQPVAPQPVVQQPEIQQPAVQQPVVQQPVVQQPVVQQPVVQQPVVQQPVVQQPIPQPVVQPPIPQPTFQQPMVQPPAPQQPVVQPVVQQPLQPAIQQPAVQQPQPAVQKPTVRPAVRQPVEQPIVQPVVQQPAPQPAPEPIIQPVVQQPAPQQPAHMQPAAQVPAQPAAMAPHEHPLQPAVDSFQVYTGEQLQRAMMPALPKSKGAQPPAPTPAAMPEPTPAPAPAHEAAPAQHAFPAHEPAAASPFAPQSLENQLYHAMQQQSGAALPPSYTDAAGSYAGVDFQAQPQPMYHEHQQQPAHPYPQEYQQPVYHHVEPHDVSPGQPICPSCHAALEANARFCSECGYSLPARVPACPTCSAPLEATAKFCGECGMSLNEPLAGDSSQLTDHMARMQDLKDKQSGWVNKIWKMLES